MLFRTYSALSVVVMGAALVATHNLQINKRISQDLRNQPVYSPNPFKSNGDQSRNLALLPYVKTGFVPAEGEKSPQQDTPYLFQESQSVSPLAYIENQSFIAAANAMVEDDPEEDGGVKIYTVEDGDTASGIAKKFNITVNTILWANTIDNIDSIKPGDQLFILPVAGLKHIVAEGESLDQIAKEYKAEKERIIAFNDLPANGNVEKGQEIMIPGGQKEIPQPTQETSSSPDRILNRREYTAPSTGKFVEANHGRGNRFPYGYCTWYVAQKRYVPWRGNAGTWLYNAKAMGYATGRTARVGSIVVTTEHRIYGHVALVESINGDTLTLSEMNYKGWGVKSKRTLSTKSRVIKGFIY